MVSTPKEEDWMHVNGIYEGPVCVGLPLTAFLCGFVGPHLIYLYLFSHRAFSRIFYNLGNQSNTAKNKVCDFFCSTHYFTPFTKSKFAFLDTLYPMKLVFFFEDPCIFAYFDH